MEAVRFFSRVPELLTVVRGRWLRPHRHSTGGWGGPMKSITYLLPPFRRSEATDIAEPEQLYLRGLGPRRPAQIVVDGSTGRTSFPYHGEAWVGIGHVAPEPSLR